MNDVKFQKLSVIIFLVVLILSISSITGHASVFLGFESADIKSIYKTSKCIPERYISLHHRFSSGIPDYIRSYKPDYGYQRL